MKSLMQILMKIHSFSLFFFIYHHAENYVQTGDGSLFATSTRTFNVGEYHLPYAWNQTIYYDAELGNMPYLVETLHANGLGSFYRFELLIL